MVHDDAADLVIRRAGLSTLHRLELGADDRGIRRNGREIERQDAALLEEATDVGDRADKRVGVAGFEAVLTQETGPRAVDLDRERLLFELRFFFSEAVSGTNGRTTSLTLVKLKVRRLIEAEDPRKPLTDDKIAQLLKEDGISVTRRSITKYREDLKIPSTHQRRVRM